MNAAPPMGMLPEAQADLVRAAFGAGDAATASWRRWRDGIDWDAHLDPVAFRLMPAVGRNLRRWHGDDPLIPRFAGIARQAWYANQLRWRRYRPILDAFAAVGVRPAPLAQDWLLLHDGSAIVEREAPLACALPGPSVDAATRCLWRHGWRPRPPLSRWALEGAVLVEHQLAWHEGGGLALDLAWQRDRDDPEGRFSDATWARAKACRLAHAPALALAAVDALRERCRDPLAEEPFGAAVDLLLHLDAGQRKGNDPAGARRPVPVDPSWRPLFDELRALLDDRLVPQVVDAAARPERDGALAPTHGPLHVRIATHWDDYRRAWGPGFRVFAGLARLPSYLKARWRLASALDLPDRFWRSLRHEWREARRERSGAPPRTDRGAT